MAMKFCTTIQLIDVNKIKPNMFNSNRMDCESYRELEDYLRLNGVWSIDPILVRPFCEGYEIIDGEHRWRAARELGWEKIPARIIDIDVDDAKGMNYSKNRLRGKIDPFILAEKFQYEVHRGLTQTEIAKLYQVSQGYVSRVLRRLKLSPTVCKEYYRGNIGEKHVDLIAKIDDRISQRRLCRQIVRNSLSYRQTKQIMETRSIPCTKKERRDETNCSVIPSIPNSPKHHKCPFCGHILSIQQYERVLSKVTNTNSFNIIKNDLLTQSLNKAGLVNPSYL